MAAKGINTITFRVRQRWWLQAYLAGVWMTAWFTGMEPDWDKVGAVILKGLKAELCE